MAEQVLAQLMPPGTLVTVPLPDTLTESVEDANSCVNVAVTAAADVNATLQDPAPAQLPFQPEKIDPAWATAVRETVAP